MEKMVDAIKNVRQVRFELTRSFGPRGFKPLVSTVPPLAD